MVREATLSSKLILRITKEIDYYKILKTVLEKKEPRLTVKKCVLLEFLRGKGMEKDSLRLSSEEE